MKAIPTAPAAHDPLAAFRRPGEVPPILPDTSEDTTYRAFVSASGSTKPARLIIRPARSLAFSRFYAGLSEIQYDAAGYSGIILVFATKRVRLLGRNLKPVVDALNLGTCESVVELGEGDSAEDGEPVIEQIMVGAPEQANPSGQDD